MINYLVVALVVLMSWHGQNMQDVIDRCSKGDGEQALQACRLAVERGVVDSGLAFPRSELFFVGISNELVASGRFAEAVRMYRAGVKLLPNSPELNFRLGTLLLHRFDAAAESYGPLRQVTKLRPEWAEAYVERARAERGMSWNEESIMTLQRAVALTGDSGEAHLELARALVVVRRYKEATVSARRALRIMPEDYSAHLVLEECLQETGFSKEAAGVLRNAIRLNPDDWYARCLLARALTTLGRREEAAAECVRAVTQRPSPKSEPSCQCEVD